MQAPLCSLPSPDTGCRERAAIASNARPVVVLDVVILPEPYERDATIETG